jgi:putative ABC transport system ATP-binding protein
MLTRSMEVAGAAPGVPIIAVEDARVTYGDGPAALTALDRVSLAVHAGEVLLIAGPSGSGKTTLLQLLGCLRRPSSGTLRLQGRVVATESEAVLSRLRLQHFGFVFQGYNLFPTLTAWENVAVALDLKGVRGAAAEPHARALLDAVGLTARADAYPAALSGGQKQRVAIARALAGDPAVILADEPTAALDSGAGAQIVGLLRGLADLARRAIVIVTHDHRLMPFADRVVTLEDGRIVPTDSDTRSAALSPVFRQEAHA